MITADQTVNSLTPAPLDKLNHSDLAGIRAHSAVRRPVYSSDDSGTRAKSLYFAAPMSSGGRGTTLPSGAQGRLPPSPYAYLPRPLPPHRKIKSRHRCNCSARWSHGDSVLVYPLAF
ncbi:hypothetical protein J6590_062709 [Homalodisca vitripennis]|nr:hypothetical protein J6590_062709 [Homalodisca vitripennis]